MCYHSQLTNPPVQVPHIGLGQLKKKQELQKEGLSVSWLLIG
jgi:hypothetical protein